MARLLPLAGVHHLRRLDLVIARIVDRAAHIRLQLAPDDIAVRVPEDAAVRLLLKVEQVHLGAQLAMVALAGLPHPVEVQIGRASCWDRVWHYGSIRGVAAPLN